MLKIDLKPKSRVPIYVQIRDQLRLMIATGELKEGEQMPPVRDLASELSINPNTVAKAYHELEREGYIYTQRGMGTFVSNRKVDRPGDEEIVHAEEILKDTIIRLLDLGLLQDEIREMVDSILSSTSGAKIE